ncbi:CPBP family intramembrane glutamic endopeptidase [Schlesneria paludicola]|uniref:CPBP family intramembrane glutamic endopeptidase n=1 Tax=Schlesneria paludicola TaxID=360056 RepID=UPI00029A1059|nr:CPBP family intramembrane glutamic endopeptidase [Schlesneria paludicola]
MNEHAFDESVGERSSLEIMTSRERPRGPRTAWIAWLVIISTIAFLILPRNSSRHEETDDASLVMQELQAKYLLGARSLGLIPIESLRDQVVAAFSSGTLRQQLIGPVLIGEVTGAKEGLKALDELRDRDATMIERASESDQQLIRLLEKLLVARSENEDLKVDWPEDERREIETVLPERLGWSGQLALLPPESPDVEGRTQLLGQARRTFVALLCVFGTGIAAVVIGSVLLLTWWGFVLAGRLSRGIGSLRGEQAIYAETFAVWLVMYVALSFAISNLHLENLGMTTILIPMIGGLGALAWPVMRGTRWRDVRTDLGLYWDTPAWTPPLVGVGSYLAALPLLGCAMVMTLVLMKVSNQFAPPGDSAATPIHPIVEPILRGNWTMRMQLMFVAVFAAVPEEIMFRGVLYRHLRDSGSRPGSSRRMIFAMLFSSFIFAAIHPQGLFGIPILMTIAMVLATVREWRGSLVPCMITHGMVNAVTTLVLFLMAD